MNLIKVEKLKKIYNEYSLNPKLALNDLNFKVEHGEFICIMGTSGSGKTTLINILSTIDEATSGTIIVDNMDITLMSETQKAQLRKEKIGFIFQNYNLIESLTIKDNILFSLKLNGVKKEFQEKKLKEVINQLDIGDIIHKYPSECSGGQQQRAAIARVLVMSPQIIFADEPTGNLDSLNAQELMKLFMKINKENNITIIMVTHDSLVASYSTKMYYMKDGKFDTCLDKLNKSHENYYKDIITITSQMNLKSV